MTKKPKVTATTNGGPVVTVNFQILCRLLMATSKHRDDMPSQCSGWVHITDETKPQLFERLWPEDLRRKLEEDIGIDRVRSITISEIYP